MSPRFTLAIVLTSIFVVLLAGCATPAPPTSTPSPAPPKALRVQVAVSEVVLGPNRLLLALTDTEGRPVANATANIRLFRPGVQDAAPAAEADAMYLGNDQGVALALYSARATFDQAGEWRLEAVVTEAQGVSRSASATLQVQERGLAPRIGDPIPASQNQTVRDTPIEQLTSQRPPGDVAFYDLAVAEALEQRKPLMVVISTPAFCQTRTCGPQLEAAQALQTRYKDRLNFIHVEVFQRPDLLLEGSIQPQVNPVLFEWKLQTEPWVFLAGADGKVFERFEGFSTEAELEEAVQRLLD